MFFNQLDFGELSPSIFNWTVSKICEDISSYSTVVKCKDVINETQVYFFLNFQSLFKIQLELKFEIAFAVSCKATLYLCYFWFDILFLTCVMMFLKENFDDMTLKTNHSMWCYKYKFGDVWQNWGRGSSVGRARDSWWRGPGFKSHCGCPLPTGWVGVSIMWPAETEVRVSQLCLGTRLRYNLVVDEDVKKPNKQTGRIWLVSYVLLSYQLLT